MGVGEGIEDLQPFDAREYAEALFGEMRAELEGEGGESEAAPSVISNEESEANEVEKSQPTSSPDDGDLSTPVPDGTSGRDDMLEDKKTSMTADEWFAETESESEEQESFRDKMRRWFS